jgi:hypothetical protein
VIPEDHLEVNFTLAGKIEITLGAAVSLQKCVRRALDRLIQNDEDPFRAALTTSDPDFNVSGRLPFDVVETRNDLGRIIQKPVAVFVSETGTSPAANDLQDSWYLRVANLIREHRRMAALPPRLRLSGWTDRLPPPGMRPLTKHERDERDKLAQRARSGALDDAGRTRLAALARPGSFRVRFYPLARCAAPGCHRLFFRKRSRDKTCGEVKCRRRQDYQTHKIARRPPGRPRHKIALPPPRSKRRPA